MTRKPSRSLKIAGRARARDAERLSRIVTGAVSADVASRHPDADGFSDSGANSALSENRPEAGLADKTRIMSASSLIRIEIDPAVSGGTVNKRFDIMIRGRVISTAPIAETRLQVGEFVTSTGFYGRPERAAACLMPDGTPGKLQAFQFNLPFDGGDQAARCAFKIIARTTQDVEYAEDFAVEVDHAAAQPVKLVLGPTESAVLANGAPPYTVMYIERGTIDDDGILGVQGWAVSLGPCHAVQIYAGTEPVAKARIGIRREDVAAVFPAYPIALLSGFDLTLQLAETGRDAATIRARLICADGFGHQESIPVERIPRRREDPPPRAGSVADSPDPASFSLLDQPSNDVLRANVALQHQSLPGLSLPLEIASPVILSAGSRRRTVRSSQHAWSATWVDQAVSAAPDLFCDAATLTGDGLLSLDGWAVSAAGIAQVRVLLDGRDVGLATFGHHRADVAKTYPDIPMAHLSGFQFDRRVGDRYEGDHDVCVVVRSARGAENQTRIAVVATAVAAPDPLSLSIQPLPDSTVETTAEQAKEFRFQLDSPVLAGGSMIEAVTGRLTIDGWLLTRSGIASFEVLLDDQLLGDVHCGLARQDVGAAFPEWPHALRSGFAFHCPPRSLHDGEHTVKLVVQANNGVAMDRSFRINVKKADDYEGAAAIRRRIPRIEVDMMLAFLADMHHRPTFQFILRQDGSFDADRWRTTLEALRQQAYRDWTVIVLAENDAVGAAVKGIVDDLVMPFANRCLIVSASDTDAWNSPLVRSGDDHATWHTLLLPGDEPGADALLEFAVAGGRHPDRDLLYGDEVRISPVTREREPFFKPDYSPDLLLSTNYIGRSWGATADLLAKTGVTPASLLADGEYDLVLRCVELASGVHHVPKLLSRRAVAELDDAVREQAALERMLDRRGVTAEVLATSIAGTWRIKRSVSSRKKVSIIIPTCAMNGHIRTCLETLRAKTTYSNYQVICIDNIPKAKRGWKKWLRQNADKVVDIPDAFNWSTFNNRAAAAADGDYLLFLNDDIEVTQADWLDALIEHAERPDVGVVGPRLLYADGKVQHAGMFLSSGGIGRHAFRYASADDPGYFGLALTQRNVIAVTGACMLVKRETFEHLGGFDAAHQIVNNDLDFCLRAHRAGLLTVFTPYASLIHHELASRAKLKDVFDLTHFNAAWRTTFAAGDPYFNPRLSRNADDYRPDDETVQWVVSGSPMFHASEIKNILVVKLDHIGDFVTALPPIRRLRQLFPEARITVLAGPSSGGFASLEPAIDEFIPFSFFYLRSQLGERGLTKDDYAELQVQLRPYRFDLAVDLRKHPSTRDVLRYTGARFLAGFDYRGQFPFLDIALDWDGDRSLQRKRSHIVDDLLALVNAVGHATDNDRLLMQPGPSAMPLAELPPMVRTLFGKPVVAIHPGAGNITKQWPEEHFAALIDLLIEKNDVNILLVGGPDDVEIAESLMTQVVHKPAVATMAGMTSLANLPRLLKNCVLYIGNDSGPKHIAAAVGVPTIGIHSGVVDPVEWGPIGPNAVALRRNMACSPCYLANADDCPRSLACLQQFDPSLVYETADMMLQPASQRIDHRTGPDSGLPAAHEATEPARKVKPGRGQPVDEVA